MDNREFFKWLGIASAIYIIVVYIGISIFPNEANETITTINSGLMVLGLFIALKQYFQNAEKNKIDIRSATEALALNKDQHETTKKHFDKTHVLNKNHIEQTQSNFDKTHSLSLEQYKISQEQFRKQLKVNHEWNIRSFTVSELRVIIKELSILREKLDCLTSTKNGKIIIYSGATEDEESKINFSDRLETHESITAKDIHKWTCEKDDTGAYIPVDKEPNATYKFKEGGEEFKNTLIDYLNVYEELAVALNNKVYDEKIILDTMKTRIIYNYDRYKDYINHRITRHKATNFCCQWAALSERLKEKNLVDSRPSVIDVD